MAHVYERATNPYVYQRVTYSFVSERVTRSFAYGVATTSRLLKMIGLFCKRAL